MTDEKQVVNEGLSQDPVEATTTEVEQTEMPSEGVTQTVDRSVYDNVRQAMQREREERKKLQAQLKSMQERQVDPEPYEAPQVEDEGYKRYLKTEALTYINNKLLTDPTFKERAEIVREFVEQGLDVEAADEKAKAKIFDELVKSRGEETQTPKPKQIIPTATPETIERQTSGNILKDVMEGNVDVPPELAEVIRKYTQK